MLRTSAQSIARPLSASSLPPEHDAQLRDAIVELGFSLEQSLALVVRVFFRNASRGDDDLDAAAGAGAVDAQKFLSCAAKVCSDAQMRELEARLHDGGESTQKNDAGGGCGGGAKLLLGELLAGMEALRTPARVHVVCEDTVDAAVALHAEAPGVPPAERARVRELHRAVLARRERAAALRAELASMTFEVLMADRARHEQAKAQDRRLSELRREARTRIVN